MTTRFGVVVTAAALLIAGCGQSPGCRAVTGGLIGAGGGAALGEIIGGNPALGAAAGGLAGAATGAFTSPGAVNGGPSPLCN
jgi:osmotically inducible lipoprotein OsmB